MLAYPSFQLLKDNLPDTEIHALVPEYTAPMAEICKHIDKIIIDPGKQSGPKKLLQLLQNIKNEHYNAVITLFSTTRAGLIVFFSRISYRLAPATKIAQIFYNHRLVQRRSRSEKPEYIYNSDLVMYFLAKHGITSPQIASAPYLSFPKNEIIDIKNNFLQQHNIPEHHKLIFIHPGSGGSANNLSPEQYAKLANKLNTKSGHSIVITAGPGEIVTAKKVIKEINNASCILYESKEGLVMFSKHIQFADLFISGSTGPLHIAGALDTPTAGFYTRRRSATSLRWQTLNSPEKRLSFSPKLEAEAENMQAIDIEQAAKKINNFIFD